MDARRRRHRQEAAALFRAHDVALPITAADAPAPTPAQTPTQTTRLAQPYFDAYPHRRTSQATSATPPSPVSSPRGASESLVARMGDLDVSVKAKSRPQNDKRQWDMDKMAEQRYQQKLAQIRARNPDLQAVIAQAAASVSSPGYSSLPTSPASDSTPSTQPISRDPAAPIPPQRSSSDSHPTPAATTRPHPQRNPYPPRAGSRQPHPRQRHSSGSGTELYRRPSLLDAAPPSRDEQTSKLPLHSSPPSDSIRQAQPNQQPAQSPCLDWYTYQTSPVRRRANSASVSEGPDPRMRPSGKTRDPGPSSEHLRFTRGPSLTKIIHLRYPHFNGWKVSVADVGDPKGMPVMVFLGLGGVRYVLGLYHEFARLAGLRLICIDRWGMGKSDLPPRLGLERVSTWPSVVAEVADQLGVSSFTLLAHSAGAPYAMATALVCPHRVIGPVNLLAPWVHSLVEKDYAYTRFMPEKFIRAVQAADMKVQQWRVGKLSDVDLVYPPEEISSNLRSPSQRMRHIGSPEKRLLPLPTHHKAASGDHTVPGLGIELGASSPHNPLPRRTPSSGGLARTESVKLHIRSRSISSTASAEEAQPLDLIDLGTALMKASNSESTEGAGDELLCILGRGGGDAAVGEGDALWGFSYKDVRLPVRIWQGDHDEKVSMAGIQWMVRELDDVQVNIVKGAGHDLMLNAVVVSEVLETISQYKSSWRAPST